jgi:hypothetical protein
MLETRRQVLDALRDGPALFAGLPGDEVDLDRLAAHLAEFGIDGGIYATDGSLEGLLWIQEGAPGETWFFEAGGQEAVLPVTTSRDLLLDITARGGTISVYVAAQPGGPPLPFTTADEPPPFMFTAGPQGVREPPTVVYEPARASEPAAPEPPAPAAEQTAEQIAEALLRTLGTAAVTAPALETEAQMPGGVAGEPAVLRGAAAGADAPHEPSGAAVGEPPAHRWPEILSEMMARVVRHRGPKLGAQFSAALEKALAEHGGRVEGDWVIAPPLPESVWRVVVDAGCAPIVAVAGRAFVDRTITSAERAVLETDRSSGANP